jgi:hypothetical protein
MNAWLGVQWKTSFGMAEEDVANLIGLVLKNISLEAFKCDRNTSDRNVSGYM